MRWSRSGTATRSGSTPVSTRARETGTALTTQFYFDDRVTATVHRGAPYRPDAERTAFNSDDALFEPALLLELSEEDRGGYLATISLDVASA